MLDGVMEFIKQVAAQVSFPLANLLHDRNARCVRSKSQSSNVGIPDIKIGASHEGVRAWYVVAILQHGEKFMARYSGSISTAG